ncbi:MAG: 2-C-methyl-D-erythritol 4-phosphate cytidylyltransferase [Clostridia bacterium]
MMTSYVVVLGGGSGERMGTGVNKVFLPLRGVPAIVRALAPFSALCAGAVVVARPEERAQMQTLLTRYGFSSFVRTVVDGGATRQASVAHGLAALPQDAEAVLVHDGARVLVTETVISAVLASVERRGSGVACVPVTDTIKRATQDGLVLETPKREELYAMQTPQGFALKLLLEAHAKAAADGYLATDDAALLEYAGMPVYLTPGDRENLKLTTPMDIVLAEAILAARVEREAVL